MSDSEIKELVTLVEDVLKRVRKIEEQQAIKKLRKQKKEAIDNINARIQQGIQYSSTEDLMQKLDMLVQQNLARMYD